MGTRELINIHEYNIEKHPNTFMLLTKTFPVLGIKLRTYDIEGRTTNAAPFGRQIKIIKS